jgi:hypothetical protein
MTPTSCCGPSTKPSCCGVTPLKAEAWPLSRDAPSRRADAIDFRQQAWRRFVASMRHRIDVADLYADALRALPETLDGLPPLPIQSGMPTLDELLAGK